MRRAVAALVAALIPCACDSAIPGAGDAGSTVNTAADSIDEAPGEASPPAVPAAVQIRPDGMGEAKAGMTIGDLRAALPDGTRLGPPRAFMVDISAMAVVRGRDTLYMVLIASGDSSTDATPVHLVGTMNSTFRTAQGVGPGTTLQEAARIYGAPRLTYNTNDESREYAHFPGVPSNIYMRVSPAVEDGVFAGIYRTESEHNETTEYDPEAVIAFVMVGLRSGADDTPDHGSR